MESLENLKTNLIRTINESSDRNFIEKLWNFYLIEKENTAVSEPQSLYETEQPMTEEEVEEYFKEDELTLHPVYLKMIEKGLDDIKNGRIYDNEEVEKEFDEWLKD